MFYCLPPLIKYPSFGIRYHYCSVNLIPYPAKIPVYHPTLYTAKTTEVSPLKVLSFTVYVHAYYGWDEYQQYWFLNIL